MRANRYRAPAIVCDADKLSQVAIIQELGRLGIPVAAVAGSARAIGFGSRYVRQRLICQIPSYEPAYIEFLLSEAPCGVLFYSNDACTENVSRHKEELAVRGFSLLVSDPLTLERVIEKDRLYQTARECGVAVPRCAPVASPAELEARIDALGLPLILKSTNLAGGIYRFVPTREAAAAVFDEMSEVIHSAALEHRGARLMAQQWIPQGDARLWNFNACVRAGEIQSYCMGRRLRTDVRPDGSLGSVLLYGETAHHAAIFEENRRLLAYLNFDGLVETEWSEGASGRYLYDFNPRPSGNIRWCFRSGVSLAEQYYRLALELPPVAQTMRPRTIYAKVLYRQNDWLQAWTNPRTSLLEKVKVLLHDVCAVARCGRHAVDVLDPKDPGPTLRAVAELASMFAGRLRRGSQRFAHAWERRFRPFKYAS